LPSASEPATVAEAAAVLREAATAGRTVSVERDGGDLVLSTRRLDRVLEHEAGDLTVVAEAGVRLSALDAVLAPYGQFLALDPPGDPTLGACVAANLSGPRRHRYGAPRDLLLGVTVVLADGTVASSGGKVVKNVAGYDLGKLFCGSRGRLGLVARVSFRLHPRPRAARTLAIPVDDPDEAQRLAQLVLRSMLVPSAVDLDWPGRLGLLFEGGERAVEAQLAEASELLGGEEAGDELWNEMRLRQAELPGRASFDPGRLGAFLRETPEAVVRVGAGAAYAPDAAEASSPLAERVRASFDPAGTLA
jgi:glycolate oxidase FAD binding subunit